MAGKVYETAIRIQAALSSTFKSTLGGASAALGKVADQAHKLQSTASSIAGFPKLEAAAKAAGERFKATSGEAAALEAEIKRAGAPTKEQAKQLLSLSKASEKAERDLAKMQGAVDHERRSMQAAGVDMSKLSAEHYRFAAAAAAADEKAKKLNERLMKTATLSGAFKNLGSNVGKLGGNIRSLTGDIARLGGLGVAAGTGIFLVAKSAADLGDETNDAAKRIGITTSALSELRYAGQRSGAEVADVDKALGKLQINLGKVTSAAKKGGGGLVGNVGEVTILGGGGGGSAGKSDPFKHIGLSAKALAAMKPDEQLAKIADGISKLKTHSEQAAAAVQIFGKGGQQLLPMLKEGSKGIEDLRRQARALGISLSEEDAKNADEFRDRMLDVEKAIGGVKNTLGRALMPAVSRSMEGITRYLVANHGEVERWSQGFASAIETKVIPKAIEMAPKLLKLAEGAGNAMEKVAGLAGGFENLGYVLVAAKFAPVVKGILDVGIAAFKATGQVAAYAKELNGLPLGGGGFKGLAGKAGLIGLAGGIGYGIGSLVNELGMDEMTDQINNDWAARKFREGQVSTPAQLDEARRKAQETERQRRIKMGIDPDALLRIQAAAASKANAKLIKGKDARILDAASYIPGALADARAAGAVPPVVSTRAASVKMGDQHNKIDLHFNVPPGSSPDQLKSIVVAAVLKALEDAKANQRRLSPE